MIDVLRIAHLRIAPQEGNLEVGNCEGNHHHRHQAWYIFVEELFWWLTAEGAAEDSKL